ncbi:MULTISPECIES: Stp1/IreP family PP2C-type Ser/Thr phosphatase [Limosilactobacillus]|jgi:serine/threonine protein phosphatase PrpC|uniref:Stp1/IreP family PP2C-type Ser/Thr phosphatase n=1 Tax=Limosilactobacillus TaxID=2742598 RepID=UPI000BEEB608|nr:MULTISPECIES: Stp1/IreP family PP2C-type Ser/Thr phosphatase [Limosilactobacillus]PEH04290.1 protein phosphatase [Lactobacillus sp. UMNPBX5]MCI6852127.1 Stp1/IreP family PP2C-type Ser/Thr phosphatase [Limosilactobacillus vaginalis]MDM8260293.1 Stp1/IreP family PP2C-type Ser/Thr phosphatase [Limosilactobacillus vaginalis]MDM8264882.1 Stp1/IreP family PP2C-type Ser/Thr phosphatase [Limosilactobacillus vaginalis]MDY4865256.1 Stp1/IreP family PP2C-type Ser/Thr phosphatase [Limosilactobacillus s
MKVAYQTDIGHQRKENQDRVAKFTAPDGTLLVVVADGIGGSRSGDVAAQITVDHLGRQFQAASPNSSLEAIRWFAREVQLINDEILQKSTENPKYQGMGTTLVAAIIFDQAMVVANIGDSRGYVLHDNLLTQVTIDHSLVNELVKHGDITEEEARNYPQNNIITRAIGVSADARIEVNRFDLGAGDQILLCSDGLSKMITREQMMGVLESDLSLTEKCSQLIKMANEAGGPDNITVLIGLAEDQEG